MRAQQPLTRRSFFAREKGLNHNMEGDAMVKRIVGQMVGGMLLMAVSLKCVGLGPDWLMLPITMIGGMAGVLIFFAGLHDFITYRPREVPKKRNLKAVDDSLSRAEKVVSRLRDYCNFDIVQYGCAARPDNVGTIQLVWRSSPICGCRAGCADIAEVIMVDDKPTRNLLGTGCLSCGKFRENPDARYEGKLATTVLGKPDIVQAIEKMAMINPHALKWARAQEDVTKRDPLLAEQEVVLRRELQRVVDERNKIAFEAGKPLLPDHPHRD